MLLAWHGMCYGVLWYGMVYGVDRMARHGTTPSSTSTNMSREEQHAVHKNRNTNVERVPTPAAVTTTTNTSYPSTWRTNATQTTVGSIDPKPTPGPKKRPT